MNKWLTGYQQSREWKIRRQKFIDDPDTDNNCQTCRKPYEAGPRFNLHHKTYEIKYGNEPNDNLVMLCRNCHKALHVIEAGFIKVLGKKETDLEYLTDQFIKTQTGTVNMKGCRTRTYKEGEEIAFIRHTAADITDSAFRQKKTVQELTNLIISNNTSWKISCDIDLKNKILKKIDEVKNRDSQLNIFNEF